MNHYPRHIGDWMRCTAHLTEVEECIYSRLIDAYYSRERPFPEDEAQCCRLVRALTPAAKKAVHVVLHEFFTLEADGWHNERCDKELAIYFAKSSKAKASAESRWGNSERNANAYANAMRTHTEIDANALRTQCEGNANQEPITKNQEPLKEKNTPRKAACNRPIDVSETVWTDFITLRKAKKSPLTETALKGIRDQAVVANLSLEDALKTCCSRGWQGFKAEWMAEKSTTKVNGNGRPEKFNVFAANRKAMERALAQEALDHRPAQEILPAVPR